MADTTLNIGKTVISDLTNVMTDYSVPAMATDAAREQDETEWINTKWTSQFGYYKTIPELKKAIDALAVWSVGKGWEADPETQIILEHIIGWGEDTFDSLMWNMIITKKIGGDAFAEIIRDNETGELINLKPLDPGSIKIIANRQGVIKRYEQINKVGKEKQVTVKFKPQEILHLCNDRVADEIHGTSVVDACEWIILARNEAMTNWKTVLHRNINPLKIVEMDTDDETKIAAFKAKWESTTKDKEVLFIPKGNVTVTIPPVPLQDPTNWIRYLENFFYQAVGIAKVILGGSEEYTEAGGKISFLSFEMPYSWEQKLLEQDLWNQLAIRIKFNRPPSLMENVQTDETKNTGQLGFQPSEMTAGIGE